MVNCGWLGTSLADGVVDLPLKILLKDRLGLEASTLATFTLIGLIPIYIKPLAGILSDAVPLFGTRRLHYLLLSLVFGGIFWVMMAMVPLQAPRTGDLSRMGTPPAAAGASVSRSEAAPASPAPGENSGTTAETKPRAQQAFFILLAIYFLTNVCSTFRSTVLGGVMVEVGKLYHATGLLSAWRQALTRGVSVVTGLVVGELAKKPFLLPTSISAALHVITAAVMYRMLDEPRTAKPRHEVLLEVKRQGRQLMDSRILWAAAGLVVLVIASPGFGTPLLYHQLDTLKFSKPFIGYLGIVSALGAVVGTVIYGFVCRFWNLRQTLIVSIIFHSVMTLWYLAYRSETSAVIITGVEAMTGILAILPLYDLSARATPKGSEALGYSLMMSVWNLTGQVSDVTGSFLYDFFGKNLHPLVWINSGTTLLVLLAVPFLPAALVDHREGESRGGGLSTDGH